MPLRETIDAPRDLRIPDKLNEVLGSLTDEGRREFVDEITTALEAAEDNNDLSDVQYVVDAWWVSRLFMTHDGIHAALDTAESTESADQLTPEQIGEFLGVS